MLFVSSSLGTSDVSSVQDGSPEAVPFVKKFCEPEEALCWKDFIDDSRVNGIEHVLRYKDENVILTDDQNDILNLASVQISCLKEGSGIENYPQLILCQGAAGSGKTVIISELERMIVEAFGADSVVIAAYTGSAALNANGRTIHSAFRLMFDSVGKDVRDLKYESLHAFQEKMKPVRFIILEEYSMIGCRLLNIINRRCMQMKSSSDPFGGLIVYMFGDLFQLAPIGDTPLYNLHVDPYKTSAVAGSLLFQSLVRTKFLNVHHRQKDAAFVQFLDNLSVGVVTREGEHFINDRFEANMDLHEVESFHDAIHLYQLVKQAAACNKRKLIQVGNPIVAIKADNNNKYAKWSSDELACNLQDLLEVCIGAKVMLRSNLWTEGGLVNGLVGEVVDIVYCDSIDVDRPAFILVRFENYHGPTLENGCVPISRILRSWVVSGIYCTRLQFPLTLAYAITVHKSQGLTLRRVVLHLDAAEMSPGIFYVALSRVRCKEDLMICGSSVNSPLFSVNAALYKSKVEARDWLLERGR